LQRAQQALQWNRLLADAGYAYTTA